MNDLLINSDVIAAIIGACIAFVFGLITFYVANSISERKQKNQITFSKKIEIPLVFAKDELKDKLRIIYENTEVKSLYYFKLSINNSGRQLIRDQVVVCKFSEKASIVDRISFPKISTIPSHEVGPVEVDLSVSAGNIFRCIIKRIGVGQIVNIEFLTTNNDSNQFEVIFGPNEEKEVSFVQGDISFLPTVEQHIGRVLFGVLLLFFMDQISNLLLAFNDLNTLLLFLLLKIAITIFVVVMIYRASKPIIEEMIRVVFKPENGEPRVNQGYIGTTYGDVTINHLKEFDDKKEVSQPVRDEADSESKM